MKKGLAVLFTALSMAGCTQERPVSKHTPLLSPALSPPVPAAPLAPLPDDNPNIQSCFDPVNNYQYHFDPDGLVAHLNPRVKPFGDKDLRGESGAVITFFDPVSQKLRMIDANVLPLLQCR